MAPFHEGYKTIEELGMGDGVAAVNFDDRKGYILELSNFLDFTKSMDHLILYPMNARTNGVIINDVPKILCEHYENSQSISFINEKVSISIKFHAPIPYIQIQYPSDQDLDYFQ